MQNLKTAGLSAILLASCSLIGCQEKIIMQDNSLFSANVVRLGDTIVAEVDGTSLYLSDIEHGALAKGLVKPGVVLTPDNPVFQSVLDELIDQRLLALEALRRSLDQNDETRRRLSASRERILSNVVVENLLAETVTDETIQRMYDEQSAMQEKGQQVRARYLLVSSEKKAEQLKKQMEGGADFAALAREFSIDLSSRDLGGDLGYFSKDSVREGLASLAFSTKVGDITAPVKIDTGWYILKVEAIRAMPQPKFADIREEIVSYMTYDEIEKLLKSLRSASSIQLRLGNTKTPQQSGAKKDEP